VADLITEKFKEWSWGKDPVSARIAVFERVRDIPYAVTQETQDGVSGPTEMLRLNRGSCQPKHLLLGEMFERLNLTVFYLVYRFRWHTLFDYPTEIMKLAKRMPEARHLCLKVEIGDELALVDATADPPLAKIGFPVNEYWDGYSSLELPFVPEDEGEIYHPSERIVTAPRLFPDVETDFFRALNEFLDKARLIR